MGFFIGTNMNYTDCEAQWARHCGSSTLKEPCVYLRTPAGGRGRKRQTTRISGMRNWRKLPPVSPAAQRVRTQNYCENDSVIGPRRTSAPMVRANSRGVL